MLDINQFKKYVVIPALLELSKYNKKIYSESAIMLMLGTALVESDLFYLKQKNDSTANGFFQMEPDTHNSMWDNFIIHRSDLSQIMRRLASHKYHTTKVNSAELITNLVYACAMCRLKYWPVTDPLPNENDLEGLARYWKQYYNTPLGDGKEGDFVNKLKRHIQ